jgi:hypothetical protein
MPNLMREPPVDRFVVDPTVLQADPMEANPAMPALDLRNWRLFITGLFVGETHQVLFSTNEELIVKTYR